MKINWANLVENCILVAVAFSLGFGSCYFAQRSTINKLIEKETVSITNEIKKLKSTDSGSIDLDVDNTAINEKSSKKRRRK